MLIQQEMLGESFKHTELKQLEKYKLALASVNLNTSVLALLTLALQEKQDGKRRKMLLFLSAAVLCSEVVDLNAQLASLPHQQSSNCGWYKEPSEFDSTTFYKQFRLIHMHFWMFMQVHMHFWMFMQALLWTDELTFHFGWSWHRVMMGTHHMLCQLALCWWCDINQILSGNTQQSLKAFNCTLQWFYHMHVLLIQDL